MKYVASFCLLLVVLAVIGAVYAYAAFMADDYAEIILDNQSGKDINFASVDYGSYHIVVKNIPRGQQSPRIMYDTLKTSFDRKFILDVTFADGTTLHETTLRKVGTGEKITAVINLHDAHTALRKADAW